MKANTTNSLSIDYFLCSLLEKPNREIFHFEDKLITSGQFKNQVEALVKFLKNACFKRSVISCDNTFFFAIAFFASIKVGLTIVMPQNNRPGYLDSIMQADDVLLYDNVLLQISEKTKAQSQIVVFQNTFQSDSFTQLEQRPKSVASDIKVIFFTSGSSGEPKQIAKKISHLEEEIKILDALWGAKVKNSVFISSVSHQHIYGLLFRLLWPLFKGNLIYSSPLLSLEELVAVNNIFSQKIFISSPAFLKRLSKENIKNSFSGFNSLFSSGGELIQKYAEVTFGIFGLPVTEVLGSTETGGIAHRIRFPQNSRTEWIVFPGVSIKTASEEPKASESGELMVKTPFAYKNDYVLTGDHVQLLSKDKFLLFERMDNIVKLEEKRVSIKEIECILLEHPLIQDSRGLVLENYRQSLGMVIELTNEGQSILKNKGKTTLNELFRDYLKNRVDLIAIPRKWRYVLRMPTNSSSKVLRSDLEELFKN